jgi:hypothetical protein
LDRFFLSAVVTKAVINVAVQMSFQDPVFSSFGYVHPKGELLDHTAIRFVFLGELQYCC